MGQNIFNITAPEDQDMLRMHLNSQELAIDADWRKYFDVHLRRAGPRSEAPVYEAVRFMGMPYAYGSDNGSCSPGSESSSRDLSIVSSSSSEVSRICAEKNRNFAKVITLIFCNIIDGYPVKMVITINIYILL